MSDFYYKYGKKWKAEIHPLQVEMWCIRQGKEWCQSQGRSWSFHFEQFRRICWPELDGEHNGQRWHALCRDEILSNKVTVLMGPGSSGKTHEAAWIPLVFYWCFPDDTCVLVSSTQVQQLRKRVWGEITDLWQKGVDRFDFLDGHLLDSALAVTTDSLEDVEIGERKIRDMRKGIFGIACVQGGKFVGLNRFVGIKQKNMWLVADEACFLSGTMVQTPEGNRPIESILPGDKILNCNGIATVRNAMRKYSKRMIKITASDGRIIFCTPTHPFFTQRGWVCACELNQSHYMLSWYEAMSILRENVQADQQRQMLSGLSKEENNREMPAMRERLREAVPELQVEVLQSLLRVEGAVAGPGISEEVLHRRPQQKDSLDRNCVLEREPAGLCGVPGEAGNGVGKVHEFSFASTAGGAQAEAKPADESSWAQAEDSWWQRDRSDSGGDFCNGHVSGFEIQKQLSGQNRDAKRERLSDMLQARSGNSGDKIRNRSRRAIAHHVLEEAAGCEENPIPYGAWVDHCEVLEQEDIERLGGGEGGIAVYNLEIEGHPSFNVEGGFLVHNSWMGESFLSAFANLNKNENFYAVVLGNPNDPIDPLGRAAEPKEGWTEDYMEPKTTRVWNTRFMNGRCVNLIGTNSPNFDFPEDKPTRFKYLISREKIADTLSFFPKDSMEYYSQCIGSMKIGTMARRVLTRKMCLDNNALEKAIWKTEPSTRVYFVDASYGGDLCVGGSGDIGVDIDGKTVLQFNEPKIIPIRVGTKDQEAEYQIAEFVKKDCEEQEIPPDCMGHDSTGRGALGTALAKVWSAETHPIESGGAPSDRPVSADLYVTDEETGERRLKLCSEHYDRKVSEFWYQVRYAVESGQLRNLPEECLSDLCTRKWDRIKRDLISVEPKNRPSTDPNKQGMKQRTGKSPDHGDWAAGIVEMARRKGFIIDRLGTGNSKKPQKPTWLDELYRETQAAIQSNQLQEA